MDDAPGRVKRCLNQRERLAGAKFSRGPLLLEQSGLRMRLEFQGWLFLRISLPPPFIIFSIQFEPCDLNPQDTIRRRATSNPPAASKRA